MAEEDMIPAFEGLHIGSVPTAKARASARASARESAKVERQEKRLDSHTARAVGNSMARENRWEEEVNDEIDRMKLSGKERDIAVRIFLLAKALAYEKKKEKKSSEIMSAEEGEKIYKDAKKEAQKIIEKEDKATAKREKSSKKGGRKTRKHGKKGKKYTKKSRRGRKHKTRKFRR